MADAPGEPAPEAIEVFGLPGTREVVAYRDGGLFPVAAVAGDGVVAVVRAGAGHLGLAGRLELIRWDGFTWSDPTVVADSEVDDRNPALGVARSGALVIAYQRQGSYDAAGVYRPELRGPDGAAPIEVMVTRSTDGGLSWDAPAPLRVASLASGSPFGKIACLADGTLLLALYARSDGEWSSWVARSTDDGQSWADPSRVARGMNETALCALPGGAVAAVMRSAGADQALHGARSFDGGRSWSAPERITGAYQHPADLTLLAGGELLLTYGNRAAPYRIEGRLSFDGGESWDGRRLLFSAPLYGAPDPTGVPPDAPETGYRTAVRWGGPTDFGYPSTAALGGRAVTIYYHQPRVAPSPDGPSHLRPPYPVTGYRAIAVSWREAELLAALRV